MTPLKVGGKGGVKRQVIQPELTACTDAPALYEGCRRCAGCGLTTGPYFEMLVRVGIKVDTGWTKRDGLNYCYRCSGAEGG